MKQAIREIWRQHWRILLILFAVVGIVDCFIMLAYYWR